jgi:succinate dehydrogenase/fumarate reductase flavoprotein subunit
MSNHEADVVVIAAGGAGLAASIAAALTAAEAGGRGFSIIH